MRFRQVFAFAASVALLTGCASAPDRNTSRQQPWYQVVVEPIQGDTDRALRYYDRLTRLKSAELSRELDIARQVFDKEPSGLNRIHLALILSLPGNSLRDDGAALTLLQPLIKGKEGEESSLRPLALLLHNDLLQRRHGEEAAQQQAARARDEQRRADGLQQKLDAIMEMEKKMIEREQSPPPKSRQP